MQHQEEQHQEETKVPLFSKWSHWYFLVIAVELILIGIFYFLTKYFA